MWSGLGIEFISAQIRGHEVNEGFLVTGMLIPLVMPVDIPLWMVAVATAFSVIIGKEVFGGTGMNIFNPALAGAGFCLFRLHALYLRGESLDCRADQGRRHCRRIFRCYAAGRCGFGGIEPYSKRLFGRREDRSNGFSVRCPVRSAKRRSWRS